MRDCVEIHLRKCIILIMLKLEKRLSQPVFVGHCFQTHSGSREQISFLIFLSFAFPCFGNPPPKIHHFNDSSERPQIGWVRINWDHLGLGSSAIILSGIIWYHLRSFGISWAHLGSSGSGIFWDHLGSSGVIWDHLGSSGSGII